MPITWIPTLYSTTRTETGRLASGSGSVDAEKKGKARQMQNVPKRLRDAVVAPPGYLFVHGDWSGIDWAMMVWHAIHYLDSDFHKDLLLRYFAGTFDPHSWLTHHTFKAYSVTCPLCGPHTLTLVEPPTFCPCRPTSRVRYTIHSAQAIPYEDIAAGKYPKERQTCKIYTHGYNYDGSPKELADNAGHPLAVGKAACAAHDVAFRLRELKTALVELTRSCHYAKTPLGWRRYFWEFSPHVPDVLAHYGQGSTADLLKWLLVQLDDHLTSTHDSVVLLVPQEEALAESERLLLLMQQPVPWLDNYRFRAEVCIARNWALEAPLPPPPNPR